LSSRRENDISRIMLFDLYLCLSHITVVLDSMESLSPMLMSDT
jgi:hypothetical protein